MALSGTNVTVLTGVCLAISSLSSSFSSAPSPTTFVRFVEKTTLKFASLTPRQIDAYVATEVIMIFLLLLPSGFPLASLSLTSFYPSLCQEPFGKAGGFAIQGIGSVYVFFSLVVMVGIRALLHLVFFCKKANKSPHLALGSLLALETLQRHFK